MEQEKKQELFFSEEDFIVFRDGLFGFEAYKKFLPFAAEEGDDSMIYLQSADDEQLSFLMMNPFLLKEGYAPVLSKADLKALGADEEDILSYYVLCVIKEPPEESTVNLKCPIVINFQTREARQVILDSQEYGLRHMLKEFSDKEGA